MKWSYSYKFLNLTKPYRKLYYQSVSLDPDQAQQSVGPDLGPNYLIRLTAEDQYKFFKFYTALQEFTLSECQTVWIHIRPNNLPVLIWVQIVADVKILQ